MRTKVMRVVFSLILIATVAGSHPPASTADDPPVQPPECNVQDVQLLYQGGVYPKWSPVTDQIVFNQIVSGAFEIFTVNADGISGGAEVTCLTCGKPDAPHLGHKGQPYWHPSGDYIVFTAENEHTTPTLYNLEKIPGMGHNHDIWLMSSDGNQYWRLTNYPNNWGVIRPSFSHDGTKLYWNEEYSMEVYPGVGSYWDLNLNRDGEEWGLWRIKYADIEFLTTGPHLSNIQTVNVNELHAGWRLGEGSGFTPDDQHFIMAVFNINEQFGHMIAEDEYITNLDGSSPVRLTATPFKGDENAEFSPDGNKIAWTHHRTIWPGFQTELYLMDADGGNKVQLTNFNYPARPDYIGMTFGSGELTWSPDGHSVAASFIVGGLLWWPYVVFKLYLITFEGPCGNLDTS